MYEHIYLFICLCTYNLKIIYLISPNICLSTLTKSINLKKMFFLIKKTFFITLF